MRTCSCPDAQTLQAFAIGRLSSTDWASIAEHVEDCAGCQRQLERLEGQNDSLVIELQRLAPGQADTGSPARDPDEQRWVSGLLSTGPRGSNGGTPESHLSADAGRDLAIRLAQGPLHLDRFELQAELGVGTFGYVFRARDPRLERTVALKVQRAGSFASDEDVQRFVREARSVAQLKHPAIVSLYETGRTEDGVCFLVCEHIDGETLEERLRRGPLDVRRAAGFAAGLADALQYAHVQGVIHRDIKPSNIIIDGQDRPHLMDFGLAKRETGEPTVTSDGRVLGTPAYMAPEQARGASHAVDARSDVYSLGVVLYEMLTGERPFQGNRRMLMLQVLEDDPRPPRQLKPELPRDLEIICLKAMSKAPARRYPTAGEFAADLRRWEAGQPILARPMGHVERGLRWCRRYPLAVSIFAAVLIGSIAGMWYLSSLSEFFVRMTALEGARLETAMLDEVWRFYSEEIQDINPQATGVSITENYRGVHPSLPLPATFAIDLGERISRRSPGMQIRVYSRHPWPGRDNGGPQDEFELAAIDWLESHAEPDARPAAEYSRFVSEGNRRMLLYFTARHMEQSCLGCHNHPEGQSPKKDWQVGDVVGVLKIVRPLDREIENTREGLSGAFVLMAATSGLLLVVSVVLTIVARRRRTSPPHDA